MTQTTQTVYTGEGENYTPVTIKLEMEPGTPLQRAQCITKGVLDIKLCLSPLHSPLHQYTRSFHGCMERTVSLAVNHQDHLKPTKDIQIPPGKVQIYLFLLVEPQYIPSLNRASSHHSPLLHIPTTSRWALYKDIGIATLAACLTF